MASQPIRLDTVVDRRRTARRLWTRLEAVHVPVYFAPGVLDALRSLGFERRIMSYTAARVAPMGAVGPEVAAAVFHGFSPAAIRRALPDAWTVTTPVQVLGATMTAVGQVLAELTEGLDDEVSRAAELGAEVAALHPREGRPLGAAWSGVPWPDDPWQRLWLAATRIRELRGDGHVACLVWAELDGVEAHLSVDGDSPRLRERLGPLRGWRDEDWDAAAARLADRGLLGPDGQLTADGRTLRADVEARTDDLAATPWVRFGPEATEDLRHALSPIVRRIAGSGLLPESLTRRAAT